MEALKRGLRTRRETAHCCEQEGLDGLANELLPVLSQISALSSQLFPGRMNAQPLLEQQQ
jgi:hypothetical protein